MLFDTKGLEEAGIRAAERRYDPEEIIFMQGDRADRLYLLMEGMVRVCKPYGEYNQATVALLKGTGGFGELGLFDQEHQNSSAEAMTYCRIASVRKADFRLAMQRRPELAVELFSVFFERLRLNEETIDSLLQRQVTARLIPLLAQLGERFDDQGDGYQDPVIPLSHSELAAMVASAREAVTKALKELMEEGLIELGTRKVTVKDLSSLQKRATGDGCFSSS